MINSLLERQIKKYFGSKNLIPRELWPFMNAISEAYDSFDNDLKLMERSFDLSSQEIFEVNSELRDMVEKTNLAKEQLEFSKHTLKSIIDNVPFGIVIVDRNKHILVANKEAAKLSGYDKVRDMIGFACNEYFCPMKDGECPVIDLGLKIDKEEKHLITKDGRSIPVLKSVIPIKMGGKEALLEGFIDLSSHKKIEKEKNKLKTQLARAQQFEAIGTLAGGIAHDFNNILGVITGYAELIKKESGTESGVSGYIDQIMKISIYGRDLVNQILTFSRRTQLTYKPLRMQDLIEDSMQLFKSTIPPDVRLIKEIDDNCPLILADETRIKQVVSNLCSNAVQAMSDGGGDLTLKLKCREIIPGVDDSYTEEVPGVYLVLTVQDTGRGMDNALVDRIFEPFFTTKKKKGLGGGLGLSVIHAIVTQHKGNIKVFSEPGKGSRFEVFLPVRKYEVMAEDRYPELEDLFSEESLRRSETILFVDDEEHIVSINKKMLEKLGDTVDGFVSSSEALDKFRENKDKYDIVVTDQVMPEFKGSDLAGEIHRIRPDIPVILTTGYAEEITQDNTKNYGINEYLLKPVLIRDMCVAIRKVSKKDQSLPR